MITDHFLNNLDTLIREKKISRNEFAEKIGVHQTTVSSWFNRKTIPNGPILDKISSLFEIEISELFIRDVLSDYDQGIKEIIELYSDSPNERWKKVKEYSLKYSHLSDGESVIQEYAWPIGRVLKGIGLKALELVSLADLSYRNEKNFYLASLLLLHLSGEKGKESAFYKMINDNYDLKDEIDFRKKQLLKVAQEIANHEQSELERKIAQLDHDEIVLISDSIDTLLSKKKSHKLII